jgi:hypothetical protein
VVSSGRSLPTSILNSKAVLTRSPQSGLPLTTDVDVVEDVSSWALAPGKAPGSTQTRAAPNAAATRAVTARRRLTG